MQTVDVAVVGLGTAGAAVAAHCARRGLKVVGLESGPLEEAGARWVNGVPRWMFEEAGFAPPSGPEHLGGPVPFHMMAGAGPERVTVRGHDLLEVDMRHLVRRLQDLACEHGAELRGGEKVLALEAGVLRTSAGALRPGVVVDASGLKGAALLGEQRVAREDLCVAAQHVYEVADVQAARAWFERQGITPGETLVHTGVAGGYSIVNVRVDGDHVSLLTGSVPGLGHPAGPAMVEAFLRDNPWVGRRLFGGARAIPLGPPRAVVGRDRVAVVGDAAGQVHAAHGSGIAQGMLAARVLAEALAAGRGVEGYNVDWQRRYGGHLVAADLFRRFSQTLTLDDLRPLFQDGVLGEGMAREALRQRSPNRAVADMPRAVLGLGRNPKLARRLVPVLTRMTAAEAFYPTYPADPRALPAWQRRLRRIAGYSDAA